ncbi:Thiamine transporter 2 [Liparis tanakae]|uniref:Thiamine transporter 2 n=1 Tax=Liparis tanakae TaxID=230148 RepID=A0A4Z2E6E7_9TELE|nr:Thiamine transporter 2 [Liparis tanakae]
MEVLRSWRADWRFPTTVLCIYGFLSTVKPMEPFLILYMTGPDKNLTIEQVEHRTGRTQSLGGLGSLLL